MPGRGSLIHVMQPAGTDTELVGAYVRAGSETAFRALVARHVDLVYATALRQVGDPGMAEEITQNVFVALARKAPRFVGVETLAGWLHRAAILEAKTTIRSELRRRRREDAAAQSAELRNEGANPMELLVPLLDEGLLQLNDTDRLALVLRFLEEKSLREVGELLGVEEEAARKRVSRALERLSEFFRRRGFLLPVASAALLFAHAASAAPVGLAATASAAGVATGSFTTFNLWLAKLMTLTKTQTAAACLLLAATPLTMQWRAQGRVESELITARDQIDQARSEVARLDRDIDKTRNTFFKVQADAVALENRQRELDHQLTDASARVGYHWSDEAPLVRIPKETLSGIGLTIVANQNGDLRAEAREALQLNEEEAAATSRALKKFASDFRAAEAAKMQRVEPKPNELMGKPPEMVRVFEVGDLNAELKEARTALFDTIKQSLGDERFAAFRSGIGSWLPVNDQDTSMSSDRTIYAAPKRVRFGMPDPGVEWFSWGLGMTGGSGMQAGLQADNIPEPYRSQLADWIAISKSAPVRPRK